VNIKQKAINGVKWTSLSTIINAIAQLLQISILARFLEPSAFGLLAIITLVIGFSQMFVDMGISTAIIHKQDVSSKQLSTLYWLNILSGFIVYGIIAILAPYIADFYNNENLTDLIRLTSITIVIQSFGKQFFVLFEKELKFNTIAKIDIVASIGSLILATLLALNNFGVYALIYPLIFSVSLKSILLIHNGLQYHRPQLYFKISDVKGFIVFGLYQMGTGIVGYFNSQFDIIIIGKVFGSETLGLYSIIKQLVMRPGQIINPVMTRVTFPTMSKVQNDTKRLKDIYLKTINYLSSVNFPIYIMMIILAHEIIILFLGAKWLSGVEIFQGLSLYALIRSTGNPAGELINAKGKPEYGLYWNIGLFFIIPITIYVGSFYGIIGVVWGWIILMLLLAIPNWYFLVNKLCGAGFKEYFKGMLKPLVLASISGLLAYGGMLLVNSKIILINLLLVSVIGGALVILLNIFFNKEFFMIVKSMVKRND